jgi:hypothetical protein
MIVYSQYLRMKGLQLLPPEHFAHYAPVAMGSIRGKCLS